MLKAFCSHVECCYPFKRSRLKTRSGSSKLCLDSLEITQDGKEKSDHPCLPAYRYGMLLSNHVANGKM